MEKNEPALIPEWLRTTTSDASSLGHSGRHRNSSRNISGFDFPRSTVLDRSSSLNSRKSSSNGSAKHAYSSFSSSRRDKDRERDKERSSFGNHWAARDSSDPLEKLGGFGIDRFQRSHFMVYGKQSRPLPQRVAADSRESGNSNHYNGNGLRSGGTVGSSINKAVFEKDFPSLGTEERQGASEIARVSSPGFSSPSQSFPVGNSALIVGEGWTSALAEVPTVGRSSDTGSLPALRTVSTSDSDSPCVTTGLNMAEAVAQAPSLTQTAPQLSVKTQRCEELAIKQSRQLIPVTPAMPKGSVFSLVDKSKGKPAVRTSDMNITIKSGHQRYSLSHHGHIKPDMPKTTGKLLVLKPGWDNGVSSPTQKDGASPTINANSKGTTSQHDVVVVTSASAKNSNSPKLSAGERKAATSNMIAGFSVEKKPSLAQTRSRNDFFNLLKKKTSTNSSAGLSDSDPHISSPPTEKSEDPKEVANASAPACCNENCTAATSNGGTCQDAKRFSDDGENDISSAVVYPDEEEAAFLRSLGWEENSGEDEGLTEEEINAFYQEYMKLSPSLKLYSDLLPKLAQSFAINLDGASSESSSSDSIFNTVHPKKFHF